MMTTTSRYSSRRPAPHKTSLIPPTSSSLSADAPARAQLRAALAPHFLLPPAPSDDATTKNTPHYHRWTASSGVASAAEQQPRLLVGDPITLVVRLSPPS